MKYKCYCLGNILNWKLYMKHYLNFLHSPPQCVAHGVGIQISAIHISEDSAILSQHCSHTPATNKYKYIYIYT